MGRRRPKSFAAWAISTLGIVLISWIGYQIRLHHIEQVGERQLARTQQLQQKLAPSPPVVRQPSPEEIAAHQRMLEQQAEESRRIAAERAIAAAEERRKEEAWERYFTPSRACMYPESNARQQVCEARKAKYRAQFESNWATSKKT